MSNLTRTEKCPDKQCGRSYTKEDALSYIDHLLSHHTLRALAELSKWWAAVSTVVATVFAWVRFWNDHDWWLLARTYIWPVVFTVTWLVASLLDRRRRRRAAES